MKLLKTFAATVVVLGFSFGSAMATSLDRYNTEFVNSPTVKAKLLNSVCRNADGANLALCDRWKRDGGAPDGDVRVGIVAGTAVVGASAGMVAAAVPFAALGGKTLIGQWGITSIAGWAPTVAVVGATGGLAGAVLGTGVAVTQ